MDFNKFEQPDSILRPAPFWAINDRITPEETARQINEMIEVGLSGGFFHSRAGLITDYLGDEWFDSMNAALDVVREKDGYLWLYDEDLWPSGNAGGQVAGMKDEYRSAALQAEFVPAGQKPTPDGDDEPKAAYKLIGRQGATIEAAKVICIDEARGNTGIERLILRRWYSPKIPWWGGESYANLLHPEAMQQFIKLTHEAYKAKLGKEFGKRIPGMFTDEPHVRQTSGGTAWWDGIPEVYAAWHGRDFWADAPYLFLEGPDARRIRLLFHRTILRQFSEAYSEPLFKWCEANGLEHTGHYLLEDNFEGQIACQGGGVMSLYRYHQAPGIDHLCRCTDPMLLTAKQVGSAARQLGRKRVLTELFGCSRHTNTFEDFKWIGDYNLVLGPNFFCPHLTWYSMRGRRKRDYPPNWNYQQTYWKELKPLNDYFTRVASALTSGTAKPDALILHSIETGMAGHRFGFNTRNDVNGNRPTMPADLPSEDWGPARAAEQPLRKTLDAVMNAGYDADLGDEVLIDEIGSVEGSLFRVGEMTYPVVIVPPAATWRPKTFELLKQFVASEGKVLLLGRPPKEIDCESAHDEWKAFAAAPGVQTIPCGAIHIQNAMDKVAQRTYSLRGPDGCAVPKLYLQHRVDGAQEIFFIVNSDRERSHDYVLTLFGKTEVPMAVWHPVDGTRAKIVPEEIDGDSRYSFTLAPGGSTLIVVGLGSVNGVAPEHAPVDLSHGQVIRLLDGWQFARNEKNVLVMDRLSASLDGGKTWWDEDMEFRIRHSLARRFGTSDALQWQPWVAIRKGDYNGKGGRVALRYRFRSAIDHPKSAYLVIEDMHKGEVIVNGKKLDLSKLGWHWDRGFGRVEITDLVRKGENVVEFRFPYDFLSEVEAAYVVGDFGVRLASLYEGEIIDEPTELEDGSWVEQGYPFYSGMMTYRTTIDVPADGKSTWLRLVRPSGIMYKVRINGRPAGKILWRPFELDLTPFLKGGINELEIEVVASRQNSHGPLHETDGDDFIGCSPHNFEGEGAVREEFSLFDYGLLGGAELVRI